MNNFLKWATWGVGISAVILILLIQLGTFDMPTNSDPLEVSSQTLSVPSQSFGQEQIDVDLSKRGTVRLMLSADTSDDAQYGLILRDNVVEILNIGFSTTGFIEVQNRQNGILDIIMPLQPWPHVQSGEPNEIWLNWDEQDVSIFVNREALLSLETDISIYETELFYYGDSFSESSLTVTLQSAP